MRESKTELEQRIPMSVTVSIFTINCKDIRNLYCGKYDQIVEREIKLIAQKAEEKTYELMTTFDQIKDRIREPPAGIDDLTETKKYISEIGIQI